MILKHFTLLSKGWYKRPFDNTDPEAIWELAKKVLIADEYQPDNRTDVLSIIISAMTPLFEKTSSDLAMDMINCLNPKCTYKIGYFTEDCDEHFVMQVSKCKYDYQTAVLYYYMYKTRYIKSELIGRLPQPDPNVAELSKALTKTDKVLFN